MSNFLGLRFFTWFTTVSIVSYLLPTSLVHQSKFVETESEHLLSCSKHVLTGFMISSVGVLASSLITWTAQNWLKYPKPKEPPGIWVSTVDGIRVLLPMDQVELVRTLKVCAQIPTQSRLSKDQILQCRVSRDQVKTWQLERYSMDALKTVVQSYRSYQL